MSLSLSPLISPRSVSVGEGGIYLKAYDKIEFVIFTFFVIIFGFVIEFF